MRKSSVGCSVLMVVVVVVILCGISGLLENVLISLSSDFSCLLNGGVLGSMCMLAVSVALSGGVVDFSARMLGCSLRIRFLVLVRKGCWCGKSRIVLFSVGLVLVIEFWMYGWAIMFSVVIVALMLWNSDALVFVIGVISVLKLLSWWMKLCRLVVGDDRFCIIGMMLCSSGWNALIVVLIDLLWLVNAVLNFLRFCCVVLCVLVLNMLKNLLSLMGFFVCASWIVLLLVNVCEDVLCVILMYLSLSVECGRTSSVELIGSSLVFLSSLRLMIAIMCLLDLVCGFSDEMVLMCVLLILMLLLMMRFVLFGSLVLSW